MKKDGAPIAWLTNKTGDGGAILPGYETCEEGDYGAFPVYARPPKKKDYADKYKNKYHDYYGMGQDG